MTRRNGTPKSAGCLFSRRWRGDLFNGLEAKVGIGADVVENRFVDQCVTALSLRFETINLRRGLAWRQLALARNDGPALRRFSTLRFMHKVPMVLRE
jgi:hypothetical protein